jgi:hypothetical protein
MGVPCVVSVRKMEKLKVLKMTKNLETGIVTRKEAATQNVPCSKAAIYFNSQTSVAEIIGFLKWKECDFILNTCEGN